MRALVLVNPNSRGGVEGATAALARLEAAGWTLERPQPGEPEDLRRAVRRAAGCADLVIAAGGDGTLNAIVDALVETGLPLGILPLGTGNDLARTLGIPADPEKAVDVLLAGRQQRIDLGRANGKYFFNVASIGLSVHIAQQLTSGVKRRLGVFAYAITVFRVVADARPFRALIRREDGTVMRRWAIQLAIGNGRHYGGGMTVHEAAAIDDGTLDLYLLRPRSFWRLALHLPKLRAGVHDDPALVLACAGRRFEVETRPPRWVNTDGEVTTRTPAVFEVVPRALAVFAPPPAEEEQSR